MQTADAIRSDEARTIAATAGPATACEPAALNSPSGKSASAIRTLGPTPQSSSVRPPEPAPATLTRQQLQFLLRVTPAAIESARQFEIPACVTIAQAILESATPQWGWGSSSLFRLANNPFGIKYCHFGPDNSTSVTAAAKQVKATGILPIPDSEFRIPSNATGKTDSELQLPSEEYGHFDVETWEIENGQKKYVLAQFQRFPNLTEAFRAHVFLLRGPRYQPAFEVRADWEQFAGRLGPKTSQLDRDHCGYSTNPSYSADLIRLVNVYRLNDPHALEWYATGDDPGPAISESVKESEGVSTPPVQATGGARS